MHLWAG